MRQFGGCYSIPTQIEFLISYKRYSLFDSQQTDAILMLWMLVD